MTSKNYILILLLLLCTSAGAQITSTFDGDADGWILRNDSDNITATLVHNGSGGNPGGYISGTLAADAYPAFFWYAPAKFLGNLSYRSYGQTLTYSQQQAVVGDNAEYNSNYYESNYADIVISNGGTSIYYHTSPKPSIIPDWATYSVTLDEHSAWRTGTSTASSLATAEQIKAVLSNVTSFTIRGNYNNSANTVSLDQVTLGQRTVATPPVISGLSPSAGLPGTSITISGSGFDPTASQNVVYFGSIAGTITNASNTSLTVTVPTGAPYDYITVINKTTSSIKTSTIPFNPTFTNGGRIIPASLDPKIDMLLEPSNELNGTAIADLDGDGWNDVLMSEGTLNAISIFRNLGLGGDLTTSSFSSKISINGAGNQPGLSTIDLDGDGKLDIAAGYASGSLTYFATFRNISTPGNLAFEAVERWPGLVYSGSFAKVIDVDGDGFPDLVGQHGNGSANVDFWIAQNISTPGNIEYNASISYFGSSTLDAGAGVNTGDLDNDGKHDFVVKYGFGGSFALIRNNSTPGTISLETPVAFSGVSSNGNIQIADFNLDGKNDLAWKNGFSNDDVHIRINTNSGGALSTSDFGTEVILNGDLTTYGALSIADINGDGKPDIMATDNGDFGVFENVYSGGVFNAQAFVPTYRFQGAGGSTYPGTPLAADLNGDDKPDIVMGVTNTSPRRVLIYENRNIHTPVISLHTVSPLSGPVGSTVTITGNNFSTITTENKVWFGAVEAIVKTATETELTVTVPSGAAYAPVSVTKAGLTAEYHLPFSTTFSAGVTFDNTHFAPPVEFTLSGADYDIDAGDMDHDGKPDILVEGGGQITTRFRNTHATGPITTSSLTSNGTSSNAYNSKLKDLDGDGYLDAVGLNYVRKNNSTTGDISFLPDISLGIGASNVTYIDLNKDGKNDIVLTSGGAAQLLVIENRTTPVAGNFVTGTYASFSTEFAMAKPATGGGVVAADFDADGYPDIVTTNPSTDNISIFRNSGAPRISASTFLARVDVATGDNPGRIYLGDFDVDGKMDMMMYHGTGTSATIITVFHNQSTPGNINFTSFTLTMPSNSTVAHVDDLDGDGKPEIIVTSETGNRFSIFKNIHTSGVLSAASFAAPFNTTVTAPRGLFTSDLNQDGKPEIMITRAAGFLLVYENLVSAGPSITISSQPTSVAGCDDETASFTLTASGTTNLTYQWQKFDGAAFNDITTGSEYSGTTTSTLAINTTGNFGAGDYRCKVSGDLASDVFSNSVTLTVNALPAAPTVTGDSKCISPTTLTLTAGGGVNGDYNWYDVATGGSVLGTNNTFTTPLITATTTYYVSLENAFCESARTPVTATINLLSKPTLTSSEPVVSGTITLCDGESSVLTAPNGFSVYTWSNGETTQQVTITTSGNYSVIVEDAGGCISPSSDPVNVVVNPFPSATISVSGTQLTASPGDAYQWYENGNLAPGATNQSFELNVLEYGVYKVEVTANGCTATSASFEYLITAAEFEADGLKIYPNPVVDKLVIESTEKEKCALVDLAGRTISEMEFQKNSVNIISTGNLPRGQYLLKIESAKSKRYFKIQKD